jgi:tetratricopeptide (TPR) repeat protein
VAVAAATLLAFLPALQNGFLIWDDEEVLLKNPRYRGLGWAEIRWMFTTFHAGHYQPLTWKTFGLDYLLWGMEPWGYHLTNLLFHAANAVLFYFLVLRLLSLAFHSSAPLRDALPLRAASGAAALLFSIHPLRVESVAWITERRDVVSAFFFLGALLCYLQAAKPDGPRPRPSVWLGLSLVVYLLSLLSKGMAMTLPVVLVVLDIYPLKRLGGAQGWFHRDVRRIWWEKVPFLILGIMAAIVAAAAQYQSGAMLSMERYGIHARLVQPFYGAAFYLWKSLVPLDLSPLYEIPQEVRLWEWRFLASALVVVAISAGVVMFRHLWPAGLAVWIYYIAMLAPTLGIAQSGPQFVADRYSYVSCLGWAVLAGAALYRVWRLPETWTTVRPLALVAVAAGTAALALLTWKQVHVWHDTESLLRYTVAASPGSSVAHYNWALLLERQGKLDDAVEHYRQAVRINPRYVRARNNLGVTLAAQGHLEEAIGHYRRVLEIHPGSAETHNNMGNALFRTGELDGALRHYQEALRIDPAYARAHNGMGIVLATQGKVDEAIARFRMAVEIDPALARVHLNLANLLAKRGQVEEAAAYYRRALAADPKLAAAHEALGRILLLQGQRDEAIRHMEEAVRIMRSTGRQE